MPSKRKRTLKSVVGDETYSVWVNMLRALVPDGRTHRLAPLVAGMLQYALAVAEEADDEPDENSVAQSLIYSTETGDPEEVSELLHDVIAQLFKDAGVGYKRTSASGQDYSIADSICYEYIHWFDMPWEA
jgi:hypothetical protein